MQHPFLIALWVIVRIVVIVVPIAGSGEFDTPRRRRASNTQRQLAVERERAQHPHYGLLDAREVPWAVFTFSAASGLTLQQGVSQITVQMEARFRSWFQDPANNDNGSQFVLTQPFTVQEDVSAVVPQSVTLMNKIGHSAGPQWGAEDG